MAIITESPSSVVITEDIVDYDVGLCYFDPATESLIEISKLPEMFLSVEKNGAVLNKLYMVTSPINQVSVVKLDINPSGEAINTYSVKCIITENRPSFSDFEVIPSYNTSEVMNLPMGEFVSVWILTENIIGANKIVDLELSLSYE